MKEAWVLNDQDAKIKLRIIPKIKKKLKYFLKKVKMKTKVIGNRIKNCSHNEIAQKCSKGINNSFCQNIINFE